MVEGTLARILHKGGLNMIPYNAKAPGRKARRGDTHSVLAYATLTDCDSFAGLHKRSVDFRQACPELYRRTQDERLLMSPATAGASCRAAAEVMRGWI